MIELILPYPISANRYWSNYTLPGQTRAMQGPSKEAKAYKTEVGWIAKAAGIRGPLLGRVALTVSLYPKLPQDAKKRMRDHGVLWDDTVMCLDLDNTLKVLLDAIKDVVIADDKFVRRIVAERFEPIGDAHVRLGVESYAPEQPQQGLALVGGDMRPPAPRYVAPKHDPLAP